VPYRVPTDSERQRNSRFSGARSSSSGRSGASPKRQRPSSPAGRDEICLLPGREGTVSACGVVPGHGGHSQWVLYPVSAPAEPTRAGESGGAGLDAALSRQLG